MALIAVLIAAPTVTTAATHAAQTPAIHAAPAVTNLGKTVVIPAMTAMMDNAMIGVTADVMGNVMTDLIISAAKVVLIVQPVSVA